MFKDFNVDGRFSSLKHEISLMNQREKRYSNYTDDYHLCFTKFILTEESLTTCSGSNRDFQQPFLKILKSFLLFKFSMIGLTEISKYLVLNPRRFGAPNGRGPCHMARMPPPSERGCQLLNIGSLQTWPSGNRFLHKILCGTTTYFNSRGTQIERRGNACHRSKAIHYKANKGYL